MTKVKADKTDGVTKEVEVPDGDYTVTVTGMGEYYGTATKTFTIEPKQMTFDQ